MKRFVRLLAGLAVLCLLALGPPAVAAKAPAAIKIGTLYASTGPFPGISMPSYYGLRIWVAAVNAEGGAYVKPYHKKIPVKLIAYDDQSSTATAATLYNELITEDKVDILVSDAGSVLTSVAVPIAKNHKMLLIDQDGTGPVFFSKNNPYIVLMDLPVSSIWPKYIADFLTTDGVRLGIRRVAILYATNDFTGSEAVALRGFFKASKAPIKIVYDHGVPTATSSYAVLINNIRATRPDAVIELGYPNNDIAYLRALQDSGVTFKWQYALFPGFEPELMLRTVGLKGLERVFTYLPSSVVHYKTGFGMSLAQYHRAWDKAYGESKVPFGFDAVAGYNTGLLLQKALAATTSMKQLALRKAIFAQSGRLTTIDGSFKLNAEGAQVGEITPLGQVAANGAGKEKFVIVYPHALATGKPVYPAN